MDDTRRTPPGSCHATRADGLPCGGTALPGKDVCFAHDADLSAQRRAGNARGGESSANAARVERLLPSSLKPVMALLIQAMKQTHAGQLEPARLSAMSAAAGAIARLYGVVELQSELDDLEAKHGLRE